MGLKRLGVLGTMIWDTIEGRSSSGSRVEEWGGIAYSLAALDAALPGDWRIVPLVKVGRDLAGSAADLLRSLSHLEPGARFVETPGANPRVRLRYVDSERRCEGLTGDLVPWTWPELGPMTIGLDAIYANFITGFECDLATMQALRHAWSGPLYGDLHSLALGRRAGGERYHRPIEEALAWLTCFDVAQMNEDEMGQLGSDPLALATRALELGTGAVCVTLGGRGAVYVAAAGFRNLAWDSGRRGTTAGVARTALVKAEGEPLEGDPTGCGDVFGATLLARLLAGDEMEPAITAANAAARRNVTYRGASGLQHHLRGALQGAAR
jgi:sugar/nucleoside kinase (ribokinase family)